MNDATEDQAAVVRRLTVEVERLRAENEQLKDRIDKHHRMFEAMRAEIERLQAMLAASENLKRGYLDENERLRSAMVFVAETFERDEAQGYHSNDRVFVISNLRKALGDVQEWNRHLTPEEQQVMHGALRRRAQEK